jgi:aminoglycoside phosphotransferase (APT) family kinase protein
VSEQPADEPVPADLIDRPRLEAHLDSRGLGTGPLRVASIGEGQSNYTFRVQREGADVVVRRGPRPPFPARTHDMVREARIQRVLREHGVRVPDVVDICSDESVLGVPFYVMRFAHGTILTSEEPAPLRGDAERRRRAGEAVVDALCDLHAVSVEIPAVAELSRRPEGYRRRQVATFSSLWNPHPGREQPLLAEVGEWLARTVPANGPIAVVHGDYRLGNVMLSLEGSPRVEAILDWEMATVGDPLADLGYLLATWTDDHSPRSVMELTPISAAEGYPTTSEIAERYAARSGHDLAALDWYVVLALWKAAVFCEPLYTRWLDAGRPAGNAFTAALEDGVGELLALAHDRARASAVDWRVAPE